MEWEHEELESSSSREIGFADGNIRQRRSLAPAQVEEGHGNGVSELGRHPTFGQPLARCPSETAVSLIRTQNHPDVFKQIEKKKDR